MEKKYELLKDDTIEVKGKTLYRIRALRDFGKIKAGDLGGYIEKERNLSHEGNCWVYGGNYGSSAKVYDSAEVYDNAIVEHYAEVYDCAEVYGNAIVRKFAEVYGCAHVCDYAKIDGRAEVFEYARVCECALIEDESYIHGHSIISGEAHIEAAEVHEYVSVYGDAYITGYSILCGGDEEEYLHIHGSISLLDKAFITSNNDFAMVQGFRDVEETITFYRTNDDNIKVDSLSLDEFKDNISKHYGNTDIGKELTLIVEAMESRFNRLKRKQINLEELVLY